MVKFTKYIAVVAGSFKPPHAGHLMMVRAYASVCDTVYVLVSDPKVAKRVTSAGKAISADTAISIWKLYAASYGLKNVVIQKVARGKSPVTAAYNLMKAIAGKNPDAEYGVIFGVSTDGDDPDRFDDAREVMAGRKNVKVLSPDDFAVPPVRSADGGKISAGDIRDNIKNLDSVRSLFPSALTSAEFSQIKRLLSESAIKSQLSVVPTFADYAAGRV